MTTQGELRRGHRSSFVVVVVIVVVRRRRRRRRRPSSLSSVVVVVGGVKVSSVRLLRLCVVSGECIVCPSLAWWSW